MSTVKKTEDIEAKPSIVGLNYKVLKKIGEGSFGVIYEGKFCNFHWKLLI